MTWFLTNLYWILPVAAFIAFVTLWWMTKGPELTLDEIQKQRRLTSLHNNEAFSALITDAGFNFYKDGNLVDYRYAGFLPEERRVVVLDPAAYLNSVILKAELQRLRRNVNMRAFKWSHRHDKKRSADIQNVVVPSISEQQELKRFTENLQGSQVVSEKVRKH